MDHEEFVKSIIGNVDSDGHLQNRERNNLEYKESFGWNSMAKYAKTMAAFANNQGGYILFGIKDKPREIIGVNNAFLNMAPEKLTENLNSFFSPEINWDSGIVSFEKYMIGFLYVEEAVNKPVIALKSESSEKINSGDVFYRYRGRCEKIRYAEMSRIIEERAKREREQILRLVEAIKKNGTANLGIVNYENGRLTTPNGVDVSIDKKLVIQVLKKAKYIKEGQFDETNGLPVLRVTGNIELAQEVTVPYMLPDSQYPYLQKNLAQELNIKEQEVYALIWKHEMKGQKKYHVEISTTITGKNKVHKFSPLALEYLREKIQNHQEDPFWLKNITLEYNRRHYN